MEYNLLELINKKINELEKRIESYYKMLKIENELSFIFNGSYFLESELELILNGNY